MTTRKYATIGESAKLYNLIVEHLHKTPGSEPVTWFYDEGWDDARVAREVNAEKLTATHAYTVRLTEFGPLNAKRSPDAIDRRFAELEAGLAKALERIASLERSAPAPQLSLVQSKGA